MSSVTKQQYDRTWSPPALKTMSVRETYTGPITFQQESIAVSTQLPFTSS